MIDPEKVTAGSLMQKDVAQLLASSPIESAVETLEEYHISGVPVVNDAGELVGVLSASDIVRSDHIEEGRVASRGSTFYMGGKGPLMPQDDYSTPTIGRETVGDWMTPRVISVSRRSTLGEICRIMDRESVHRVFVVEKRRLIGVISSSDVVHYVASKSRHEGRPRAPRTERRRRAAENVRL